MIKPIISFSLASALAACGGANTNNATLQVSALQTTAQSFVDLGLAVNTSFRTPDASFRKTGDAVFNGVAYVVKENTLTGDTTFLALGVAEVEVDFTDGQVTAEADSFFEVTNGDALVSASTLAPNIQGQEISGVYSAKLTQDTTGVNAYTGQTNLSVTKLDGSTLTVTDLSDTKGAFFGAGTDYLAILSEEMTGDIRTRVGVNAAE